ncbi:acyl-CoA/acyl-ACP dehydrogenase [Mycobacterium sp. Y57]|uniref:acyl-CoA dehydrogenase family protein n=1 Tax=Mycolicibacterium xanthum TaxID=2796469 RepID=UPI001C8431BD|nr:acyl-CoA dehydrogenase family protein [Mycolicibacterium xanthum]MBX7431469.1 acyl-CoA/acyl-ACP dehydrogenase [Mycolicibacterium xanthum]
MMDAVFAEYRESHPPSPPVTRDPALWRRLDELGLVRLTGPEYAGGSGATWHESAELISAAARHGVRIPLAEHDLLACWLLDAAGETGDDAARTVCLLDDDAATGVPWASTADRIVVVWPCDGGYRLADLDADAVSITLGANMIGEPRDTVVVDTSSLPGVPLAPALLSQLSLKSALVRSIQVCAALDRALQLCLEHTTTRRQFGRPLSKFQAVQHQVADIAAEAALAHSATEAAVTTAVLTDWSGPHLEFFVAVARSCAGHAASVVARNAHQVHGAIGTTGEHRLHEFTRAALAWSSEFGSVRHWDETVTEMALWAGEGRLWELICP